MNLIKDWINSILKKNRVDYTLKRFLSFMLDNKEDYSKVFPEYLKDVEKNELIYNCAMNTIDEYLDRTQSGRDYIDIFELFKENFRITCFENCTLSVKVSDKTLKIIEQFEYLKYPLSKPEKSNIMNEVDKIITSTT